jgi:hypothetical protein
MCVGVWSSFKEVEMRRHVLVLTTTAAIFTCGAIAASAQPPSAITPGSQQGPTIQPPPGGSSIREHDQDSFSGYHGMMGPGMMGHGMMGPGYGHHDWHQGRNIAGSVMMRMMFSLMDADGDGKLSLQEFQAAHERIFKAMDANKDGFVTLEEMQDFLRGGGRPTSPQ